MFGSFSPFGLLLVRRALVWFGLLSAVTLVAVWAAYGGSYWAMHLARWAVASPVLLGLACAAALGRAARHGELRTLHAMGASPVHIGAVLSLAGLVVALLLTIALSTRATDVSAVFPALASAEIWTPVSNGFANPELGVRIARTGEVAFESSRPVVAHAQSATSRWAAWLSVVPAVLVVPLWVALPFRHTARGIAAAAAGLSALLLLHVFAAGHLHTIWMLIPACILAGQTAVVARRATR